MDTTLYYLGALSATYLLYNIVSFASVYLRPSALPKYLHTRDAQKAWALVTGSSNGLGEAFAHELCAQGFNVVLHGRNRIKLAGV